MSLEISTTWLLNYLLLIARAGGFVVFLPLPGLRQILAPAKILLATTLSILLMPVVKGLTTSSFLDSPTVIWTLAGMIVAESMFGLALGAAIALLLEVFGLAAQVLGFQAGYSYVNMVDPNTQVDASILNVLLALMGSLLFFAFDLHLYALKALAASFADWPLGRFTTSPADAWLMVELGGVMFETAVRLAFPVVAVLLLIDLTLALLNQINSRLQLLTLAFPIKIVAALALLYPLALLAPRLFYSLAAETQRVLLNLAHG